MNRTAQERERPLHGVMAEFDSAGKVLEAARRARGEGYREMDAYSPFPVAGLPEEIGARRTGIATLVLGGGIAGALAGFGMQYFVSVVDYPVNVGGRPLNSWLSFIPVTFELTVLVAGLTAVVGMLALNRLPKPYHPVFNVPGFRRASRDRFFLCIEASDPRFERESTRRFLEGLGPLSVTEVEA